MTIQQTTPTITTSKPLVTLKQSDTPAQAALRIILAAKEVEGKGKDAQETRKHAESVLAGLIKSGDTITLDGNRTYSFTMSERERVIDSKIITALRILHPELVDEIDRLSSHVDNRTKYVQYNVKRLKV